MTRMAAAVAYGLVAIVSIVPSDQREANTLSGSWRLELNPDFGGEQDSIACEIPEEKDKGMPTLNCGGPAPFVLHVNGKRVTFDVETGRNDEFIAHFSGVLDDRQTRITGKWELDDGKPREGKFELRRQ